MKRAVTIDVVPGASRPEVKASRYDDTVAYKGGDAVILSDSAGNGSTCSTGFELTEASDGYAYAVTAGHCYQNASGHTYPKANVIRTDDHWSTMGQVWTASTDAGGTSS